MGSIDLGNTLINKIYLGSNEIQSVYLGSTLIWSNSVNPPQPGTVYYRVTGSFQNNNSSSYAGMSGTIVVEDSSENILGSQNVVIPGLNSVIGTSPDITFVSSELATLIVKLKINNTVLASVTISQFQGGGTTSESPKVGVFNATF